MHTRGPRTYQDVTDTDEFDWQRALRGDGESFARVFDRHRDRVFRHALRLAPAGHDAEDLVAITFLELWRRRDDVRLADGNLLPWLLVTTTNVSLNQRRAARRYRSFLSHLPSPSAVPTAEDQALAGPDLDLDPVTRSQIRQLPADDRNLLVLIALEGFSVAQAGRALDMSEAAARSRWQRLRARLSESLPHPSQLDNTGSHQ